MKVADLSLDRLLELDPEHGIIRLAGERALLLDAVALGLLRRELVETVGATAARGILTRFGYAHGWRAADSLRDAFEWDDESEWKRAGGRFHVLQGMVKVEPNRDRDPSVPEPLAEAIWRNSYEAEQHLLHLGRAEGPVCWSLVGFASGYLSRVNGREVICIEHRCAGAGDPVCVVEGRYREDWGDEIDAAMPYYSRECLDASLARVTTALRRTERRLRAKKIAVDPGDLLARSEPMRQALDTARRVAKVDTTVLITGESGVGKERIARMIHEESPRAGAPFLAINCGAVTDSLLESELFGHVRGSFTGAIADRPGLFEAAKGGTLLLDEIGEVPPPMQVKLLRVLQEKQVRRVGENRDRPVDVRLLAATNRDLAHEVEAGRFRRDLYYRLRVIELHVPPLRERRDDVLPLARSFLEESARRHGAKVATISPGAAERLLRHDWPGNVRELENAIERAVVLASGTRIEPSDLPEELRAPRRRTRLDRTLDEVERDHILGVLEACEGNRAQAAVRLGIGEATLYRRLSQYREG